MVKLKLPVDLFGYITKKKALKFKEFTKIEM